MLVLIQQTLITHDNTKAAEEKLLKKIKIITIIIIKEKTATNTKNATK